MGISPIGWLHTLGSLPAIPLAAYMLVRHGRITPDRKVGWAYFGFMLLGVLTVYPIAHQPVSKIAATLTLLALLVGYGIALLRPAMRIWTYLQTAALSLSVLLLMVPTMSETLRRLPVGHPLVQDPKDPLLLGVLGALCLALVIGLPVQLLQLHRQHRQDQAASDVRKR